jgi:hypothetical protein
LRPGIGGIVEHCLKLLYIITTVSWMIYTQ